MERYRIFSYAWHIDDQEEDDTVIRVYGLDEQNKNVCLRIEEFRPYVYLELPTRVDWTLVAIERLKNKLAELMKDKSPTSSKFESKRKLYGAHMEDDRVTHKEFPFLKCAFKAKRYIFFLQSALRKSLHVEGLGHLNIRTHEQDADPILQLCCARNIPTAGWIDFRGYRVPEEHFDRITSCDVEFRARWQKLEPYSQDTVPRPLIMGFDIEVNSSNPARMPSASHPGDCIFQISCVVHREGDPTEKFQKYLLTLGEPEPSVLDDDTDILMFGCEADLLEGFTELVNECQPNLIAGYNILGFDIPYMIGRAELKYCIAEFSKLGFHTTRQASRKTIKWSSAAYKNQEFEYLDAEGRIFVDLMPLVKRDFKMDNYRLKTVAEYFLGKENSKDPLTVKGIFKCYRIGIKTDPDGSYNKQARKAMAICGKYCLSGTTLVSGRHGCIPIQSLQTSKETVLSWNQGTNVIELARQSDFMENGKKDCVELQFEDGRTIVCTPDHRIATPTGWVEAQDLAIGERVNVGPILPTVEADTKETILARVIGYLSADAQAYFGNQLDCDLFVEDVEALGEGSPTLRNCRNCLVVCLPIGLRKKIIQEDWIVGETLPDFTGWSQPRLREFVAGLFGGDGWTPSLDKKDNKFTPIGCTQSRGNNAVIRKYMDTLSLMLAEFDIPSRYRITDRDGLFIGDLEIPMDKVEAFTTKIGYRYCYRKTLHASVVTMFHRTKNLADLGYRKVVASAAYGECLHPPTCDTMQKGGRPAHLDSTFPRAREFVQRLGVDTSIFDVSKESLSLPVMTMALTGRKLAGMHDVFDITVDGHHSFMAEGVVVHNCVQDSLIVNMLIEKLKTWAGLTEMARVCNVPMFTLYTKGQQIKVFSQVYKFCLDQNILVERDGYQVGEGERYVGAHVFDPIPGCYDVVVPFDFASLYPTTIIAYNIDYSTWVTDPSIPDELCHVMQWEDHISCAHDPKIVRKTNLDDYIATVRVKIKKLRTKRDALTVGQYLQGLKLTKGAQKHRELMAAARKKRDADKEKLNRQIASLDNALKPYTTERADLQKSKAKFPMCAQRYYRFLKEPKGVIPTILQNLLDARRNTRAEIKKQKKRLEILEDPALSNETRGLIDILDKRQLSYKVSANSMYGIMGVQKGYLPFMPGAMCVTFMGRTNIELTAKVIQEDHGAKLIYGDTDSVYVHFPNLTTAHETWDYAEKVAEEVTKLYPSPMKLEYEEVIYWRFFILTKKRYMYTSCLRDGVVNTDVGKKGVLLARRDNCQFVRGIYEQVISRIFERESMEDILYYIFGQLDKLCGHGFPNKDFVVTKSVGNTGELKMEIVEDEHGVRKGMVGDYTVPILPLEEDAMAEKMHAKGVTTVDEYYLKCLPAQAQLAEKMKRRGQRADAGSRLEYVVTVGPGHTSKQYEKIEDFEYFSRHSDVLKLDYMSYLKLLTNPLDQVLNVAFGKEPGFTLNLIESQYKLREKVRNKMLGEMRKLWAPRLELVEMSEIEIVE